MTFEEWQLQAQLQYTVYEKFLSWLREVYDFENDDIYELFKNPNALEEFEFNYWDDCINEGDTP